ncbi:bifunctional DNA primase/polymerase [Jiangella aurantiaca]|uniref:Bifunctional DNA primase/polymerase n=1 Tax=Jiangella aurantiaca TaxID=2530373 RepID=A0A4R5A3H8_9ACTN|nr:bifunctional DNA primase/polymerase [Jiangella aurantiaca]
MTMGDEAAVFAAAGIPVFPCWPGAKEPLTKHGFEDATTHLGQVRDWWRKWPTANVAVPTGAPLWDVVDVDVKPDGSGYPALRRLKQAGLLEGWSHAVRTPSGGLHLYFAGTAEGCHSLRKHKIDLRPPAATRWCHLRSSTPTAGRAGTRPSRSATTTGTRTSTGPRPATCSSRPHRHRQHPSMGMRRPTVACPTWSITSATPSKATETTPCSGPPTARSTTGRPISDRWWPLPSRQGWTTARPRPPQRRRNEAARAQLGGGHHH